MAKARPTAAGINEARRGTFLEVLEAVVIALVLAFAIRTFAVQAFKIPSGSMLPTLQVGDHILVNKFLFGLRIPFVNGRLLALSVPHRGDIIVFRFPKDHQTDFIKRLAGQPGDEVEIVGRQVFVNGKLWEADPGHYQGNRQPSWVVPGEEARFGPIYVPKKGDVLQLMKGELMVNDKAVSIPKRKIIDEGNFRDYYDVFYADLFPSGVGPREHSSSERVVIDEDRFFMIGDNRDNSRDGRFWGLVRDSEIRGKAFVIYWSWNRDDHRVRWGRIGDGVG